VVVVLVFLMAAILGAVAVVATGRGGELGRAEPDRPPVRLPDDRMVEPVDLNRLRLPIAFRGYRMADVDRVLDRLAGELADRDRQIDALGQELLGVGTPPLGAFHDREQTGNETRQDGAEGDEVRTPSHDHESSDPS
jgi:DivIVA domain-containing protein